MATQENKQGAQQGAQQAAQSVSEAARQAASDTVRQIIDASRTAGSQEVGAEREFETGTDEAFKFLSQLNAVNAKRAYDEYQGVSLDLQRKLNDYHFKYVTDAQQHDNVRQNVANQALQNAVETANMVGKQAVRHSDLAIDREWNVDEVAQAVAKTAVFSDAIAAAVAAAVAASISKK